MHLSSMEALVSQLLDGTIDPNEVDRMIAYGTILKPGANVVALYMRSMKKRIYRSSTGEKLLACSVRPGIAVYI